MATYMVKRSCAMKGLAVHQEMALLPKPLYFVPIPLHPARLRERGYNQAEKIAGALASACGGRVWRLFRRKTFVVSQTKLSKEGREWNVAGAFEMVPQKRIPACGTVIVVDDVYTTGATTTSCLGALGNDFPLPVKVCTLLYDEPATAAADFAADNRTAWDSL
ncbi:phosphoribosyl transferase-like protein [Fibrobacter sp. UWR4]|nr:phosphoribosyl transferase-like protein [Fibrobacter sp. UWR4]